MIMTHGIKTLKQANVTKVPNKNSSLILNVDP